MSIRLEFDVEHHKMRETFTLIEDYALPQSYYYHGVITRAIQEDLSNFKAHIANVDVDWKPPSSAREIAMTGMTRTCGRQTPEDLTDDRNRKLLEDVGLIVLDQGSFGDGDLKCVSSRNQRHNKCRKVAPVKAEESDAFDIDKEMPRTADEIEIDEKTLDIILGSMKLDDQFEWDLENADASPSNLRTCMRKRWALVGNSKRPSRIAHANKF
ncbi:hypothetical protein P692DRAFT_20821381 [Suillus brevipes Sb2]|nr:hypothetical protein P692DRAFT_20821381 [Suillus brevipes Sb2]